MFSQAGLRIRNSGDGAQPENLFVFILLDTIEFKSIVQFIKEHEPKVNVEIILSHRFASLQTTVACSSVKEEQYRNSSMKSFVQNAFPLWFHNFFVCSLSENNCIETASMDHSSVILSYERQLHKECAFKSRTRKNISCSYFLLQLFAVSA